MPGHLLSRQECLAKQGWVQSLVFRLNEKAAQSGKKLHWDLVIISYCQASNQSDKNYYQPEWVSKGALSQEWGLPAEKPGLSAICRLSFIDHKNRRVTENWLVQLGWLARVAQVPDCVLLTGVAHSRKDLVISRKKAFFKLFIIPTVPTSLHRTRGNQLKLS